MKNHIELLRDYGFRWGNPDEFGEFHQNDGTAMFMQGPDGKIWKTSQLQEVIDDIESGALQKRLAAESQEGLKAILKDHAPDIVEMVEVVRGLVKTTAPELHEEVKSGWGALLYRGNGMVCAITPRKTHIHLTFYKGTQLTDPEELLTGSGEELRHIEIYSMADIQQESFASLIREALHIDQG